MSNTLGIYPFKFNQEQLQLLRSEIGQSEEVDSFLAGVEMNIYATLRAKESKVMLINSDRKEKIGKIVSATQKLNQLLNDLSIQNNYPYSDEEDAQLDSTTSAYIEQESRGFIYDLTLQLEKLEQGCEQAIELTGKTSERQNVSWQQWLHNDFDRNIVFQYHANLGTLPGVVDDGPFCKAMEIFYQAAGIPSRDFYQRLRIAVSRRSDSISLGKNKISS